MIDAFSTVTVNCDPNSEDEKCWGMMGLKLNPGETIEDAIEYLKEIGWHIESKWFEDKDKKIKYKNYICICPWCEHGKERPEGI